MKYSDAALAPTVRDEDSARHYAVRRVAADSCPSLYVTVEYCGTVIAEWGTRPTAGALYDAEVARIAADRTA